MIDVEQLSDKLKISYINENGTISFIDVPLREKDMYNWCYVDNPNAKGVDKYFKSYDGKPIKKIKTSILDKFRIEEILINQSDDVKNKIHSFNIPKKHFFDIEVVTEDGVFPEPSIAKWAVNSISIVSDNGEVLVIGTDDISKQESDLLCNNINEYFKDFGVVFKFKYIKYETEYDMLYTFMDKIMSKITLLTGWNCVDFDWTYIINRCKNIGINPAICSVSGKLDKKTFMPLHRLVVDYLKIYQKWDRYVEIKENDSLDYVSKQVLDITKIKYNGSLHDLYKNDFCKFIYYNAVDSILVHFIDKKINTLLTFLSISNYTKIKVNLAFSPVAISEYVLFRELYKKRMLFVNKYNKDKSDDEGNSYEGAYVKEPIPNLYDYIACFDFASLYPSIMRQFNISPESYVENENSISEQNKIKTISGSTYIKNTDSVTRIVIENLFNERKKAKQKYMKIEKEISYLKSLIS